MPSAVLGAMQGPFAGTLATMALYGVICMQTFHYAYYYASSDRLVIRWLVVYIWILESVHTAFSIHFIEYYLMLHFADPAALNRTVWTMPATYVAGFLVAWAVNLFFVWRIWQISKRALICIPLAILSTVRTGVGIMNPSYGLMYPNVQVFLVKVHPSMVAGWSISAFADTLIAMTMCYYLHKQRSGVKRTDHIINTLLMYSINTGALTSVFAILVIITFLALPGRDFTAFVQVQSKLYAISVLASLNARKQTLEDARAAVSTTANNMSFQVVCQDQVKLKQFPTSSIEVRKHVEEHRDVCPSTLDSSSYP